MVATRRQEKIKRQHMMYNFLEKQKHLGGMSMTERRNQMSIFHDSSCERISFRWGNDRLQEQAGLMDYLDDSYLLLEYAIQHFRLNLQAVRLHGYAK